MLKAMIVGLGQIGLLYDLDPLRHKPSSHTTAYLGDAGFELIAAADIHPEREADLHSFDKAVRFYPDAAVMLQEQQADVISICTPSFNHLALVQQIVSTTSTRLIFCEKPVVANIEEARSLLKLMQTTDCVLMPNLSRRWNKGMERVYEAIRQKDYGDLQRLHLRYTRGIFNTGSHIFDLVNWFAGRIGQVLVIEQVPTSADRDGDPSFTLHFKTEHGIGGYAEAFNDEHYYMFEIDLYFSGGKITIFESGNKVLYEKAGSHPLFSNFKSLHEERFEDNLLEDSTLKNAVAHIAAVLSGEQTPVCRAQDGLIPIFIAEAILQSHRSGQWEPVELL